MQNALQIQFGLKLSWRPSRPIFSKPFDLRLWKAQNIWTGPKIPILVGSNHFIKLVTQSKSSSSAVFLVEVTGGSSQQRGLRLQPLRTLMNREPADFQYQSTTWSVLFIVFIFIFIFFIIIFIFIINGFCGLILCQRLREASTLSPSISRNRSKSLKIWN